MSASAHQWKHEEERPCCGRHFIFIPFYYFLLTWGLWLISTLCVADMVHAVADMVCGRYRRFPLPIGVTTSNLLVLRQRVYV